MGIAEEKRFLSNDNQSGSGVWQVVDVAAFLVILPWYRKRAWMPFAGTLVVGTGVDNTGMKVGGAVFQLGEDRGDYWAIHHPQPLPLFL